MATYRLTPDLTHLRSQRASLAARAALLAAAAGMAWSRGKPDWLFDLGTMAALAAAGLLFAVRSAWTKIARADQFELTVGPHEIRTVGWGRKPVVLPRAQIVSFSEPRPGAGLGIRAKDRALFVSVPADLEGYDACRTELVGLGIPEVPPDALSRLVAVAAGPLLLAIGMAPLARSAPIQFASWATLAVTAVLLFFVRRPGTGAFSAPKRGLLAALLPIAIPALQKLGCACSSPRWHTLGWVLPLVSVAFLLWPDRKKKDASPPAPTDGLQRASG